MIVTSGEEWSFDKIDEIYGHIETIAKDKYGLNFYPTQLEIISYEQMLDAYCSSGLPIHYPHWSHGEQYVKQLESYTRGRMGLAYEIVINSDPCISYLMEENTMLMQTMVIAHAAFGHNHFFKNNYLFKQWTDPEGIVDYLLFAKKFIRDCEELYGVAEVEQILDAAHALQPYGVDKYNHPESLSVAAEEKLRKERDDYIQSQLNSIWSTVPNVNNNDTQPTEERFPRDPNENILYFIEKNAPRMESWQREIIRIVRKISQYFYPQTQTKIMNEGCATFFHYKIVHDLQDNGMIDDGAMLEFYHSHTNVTTQPSFDDERFNDINPYAIGLAIYQDIERISMNPTDEDRDWFRGQDWVGGGDWLKTVKWAIENFKDESFILQFLSPKVMRDFRLFAIRDDKKDPKLEVSGIHNESGYKAIRSAFSEQSAISYHVPDVQVYNVDRWGDRTLTLRHYQTNSQSLDLESTVDTLTCVKHLWGYDVQLESIDPISGDLLSTCNVDKDGSHTDVFITD